MAAESTLLTINREELVKNIRFVEPFLDKLLQRNQLTTEECDVVRSGKTPQDRARALIDLVGTKGQEAFSNFRHALKQTNPELEDILHRCVDHNKRIKLHCDDCVQLLCRTCSEDAHKGHRVTSIVAAAGVIRRKVTTFVRENRKLLKTSYPLDGDEDRENLLQDIEQRKSELRAMFNRIIEEECRWCKDQLSMGKRAISPVVSISSVATTESELSGSDGPEIEPTQSRTAKRRRERRAHPYSTHPCSRVVQNDRGMKARSPVPIQGHIAGVPNTSKEFIDHRVARALPRPFTLPLPRPYSSPLAFPKKPRSPFQRFQSPTSTSPFRPYTYPAANPYFQSDSHSFGHTNRSRSPLSPITYSHHNSPTPSKPQQDYPSRNSSFQKPPSHKLTPYSEMSIHVLSNDTDRIFSPPKPPYPTMFHSQRYVSSPPWPTSSSLTDRIRNPTFSDRIQPCSSRRSPRFRTSPSLSPFSSDCTADPTSSDSNDNSSDSNDDSSDSNVNENSSDSNETFADSDDSHNPNI